MGDIYVHERLQKCCRKTLEDLDKRKKRARVAHGLLGVGSLHDAFADKTVEQVRAALPGGEHAASASKIEQVTLAACQKVCLKHAGAHADRGEAMEAELWRELGAALPLAPGERRAASTAGLAARSEPGSTEAT
jgi:hypothetical protein